MAKRGSEEGLIALSVILAIIAGSFVAVLIVAAACGVIVLIVKLVNHSSEKQEKKKKAIESMSVPLPQHLSTRDELVLLLNQQRYHADQARRHWDADVELSLCYHAISAIKQAEVRSEDKTDLLYYWEERVNLLKTSKTKGMHPSALQASYDRKAIQDYSEQRKQFIELLKERHSVFDEEDICQGAIDKIKAMPGDYESKSGYVLYWSNRKKKAQKERIEIQNSRGTTIDLEDVVSLETTPGLYQTDIREPEEKEETIELTKIAEPEATPRPIQSVREAPKEKKEAIEPAKETTLAAILQSLESHRKGIERSSVQSEELSKAIQNNTVSKDLLKPDDDNPSRLLGYDDWKQDVIDYVAAVHLLGRFKNRYSAMQSAVFVANKIILDYLASDGETDFFAFVLKRCDEMPFSTPSEKLVYDLNGEIAKMLSSGAKEAEIRRHLENRLSGQEKASRPKPEDIYPLESTGNTDIDSFARLAKAVSHIRLKHLKISNEEIDEGLEAAGKKYNKREWKTFEDYFSNAFQFGYLTERRFQRLYTILYNIAKAKQNGLSNTEIINQVGDLYVIDQPKKKLASETNKSISHDDNSSVEIIPYRSFTKEEHSIIAVASRVTRALYHHRLFKRTAKIAINLINQYHRVPPADLLPEKQYITISAALLKREDSLMSTVYDTIVHITDCVFSGKSEGETFNELKERELRTFVESGALAGNNSNRQKLSVAQSAYLDLKDAITASEVPSDNMDLMPLASHLNELCHSSYSTKRQYFKAMLALINQKAVNDFKAHEVQVLKYILLCKINDAPNVSFRALVGSKFPELYRKKAPNNRKR